MADEQSQKEQRREIAFCSTHRSGIGLEIYTMNSDGTELRRLSPDGEQVTYLPQEQIAFWSNRERGSDIYRMNVDGTGFNRVGGLQ